MSHTPMYAHHMPTHVTHLHTCVTCSTTQVPTTHTYPARVPVVPYACRPSGATRVGPHPPALRAVKPAPARMGLRACPVRSRSRSENPRTPWAPSDSTDHWCFLQQGAPFLPVTPGRGSPENRTAGSPSAQQVQDTAHVSGYPFTGRFLLRRPRTCLPSAGESGVLHVCLCVHPHLSVHLHVHAYLYVCARVCVHVYVCMVCVCCVCAYTQGTVWPAGGSRWPGFSLVSMWVDVGLWLPLLRPAHLVSFSASCPVPGAALCSRHPKPWSCPCGGIHRPVGASLAAAGKE